MWKVILYYYMYSGLWHKTPQIKTSEIISSNFRDWFFIYSLFSAAACTSDGNCSLSSEKTTHTDILKDFQILFYVPFKAVCSGVGKSHAEIPCEVWHRFGPASARHHFGPASVVKAPFPWPLGLQASSPWWWFLTVLGVRSLSMSVCVFFATDGSILYTPLCVLLFCFMYFEVCSCPCRSYSHFLFIVCSIPPCRNIMI